MKNCVLPRMTLLAGIVALVSGLALTAGLSHTFTGRVLAAEKHPFGFEDYAALQSAQAVAVSPDGKSILYREHLSGATGSADKHDWHVIDVSGENARKLDLPEHFEPSGFTKDGAALYGTYAVGKGEGIGVVPFADGKTTRILALPSGVHGVMISPNGKRFAALADPRKPDPLAGVHTVVESEETSLYVVDVDGANGGWWCPSLADVAEIAWSPDGTQVAVVSQWPKLGHHELHSFIDVCGANGARRVAEIPNDTAGIAWDDGGKELVFASTSTPTITPEHVWTVPAAGGKAIDRTPDLVGTAMNLSGDPQGNIWVEMHKGVVTEVDAFRDGKLEAAFQWPGGIVNGLPVYSTFASMGASNAPVMAFNVADPSHATNIAVAHGMELQKITHEGDDTLASVALGDVKTVHWTSKEGIKLEGIATFPPGFMAGKKYPFLVFPHGGPEANDQLEMDAFARYIAGMGYVVIQPEYRGSTGYGADFLSAIYQHFGDRAYKDVDSATDFAIEQGWADPNRLAIFGWSAGGFMTSWTVTQTNRYKAAIEGAGITDWLSFIPTSDTWQVDYDAHMEEKDPTPMLQFSAVMFADRVTTPLLILHGEADVRVPTFQGHEYYALLAERGKTVRMVTYPGSPHFPRLMEQRRDVFRELGDWLKKYNP